MSEADKPTVRSLLIAIIDVVEDTEYAAELAREALIALDADEGRTIIEETGQHCRTCVLSSFDYQDGATCNHSNAPENHSLPFDGRPDWCPLNNGGQVLVRLAEKKE